MKKVLFALSAIAIATVTYAKGPSFAETDLNQDGKVDKEEYVKQQIAARPEEDTKKFEKWFANKDKDGDGFLTPEEFTAKGKNAAKKEPAPATDIPSETQTEAENTSE